MFVEIYHNITGEDDVIQFALPSSRPDSALREYRRRTQTLIPASEMNTGVYSTQKIATGDDAWRQWLNVRRVVFRARAGTFTFSRGYVEYQGRAHPDAISKSDMVKNLPLNTSPLDALLADPSAHLGRHTIEVYDLTPPHLEDACTPLEAICQRYMYYLTHQDRSETEIATGPRGHGPAHFYISDTGPVFYAPPYLSFRKGDFTRS